MFKLRSATIYLLSQWKYSPVALYISAFCMSVIISMLLVALPWRILTLNGGDFAAGSTGGLLMGIYVISCILIRPHLDHLGMKRLVMISSFLTMVNCGLLALAESVPSVLGIVCLQAIVNGAFWSPLMGWLSGVHEGKTLNHRLGRFSFSWALGNIIGVSIAGPLLNIAQWLPFVCLSGIALAIFILAAVVHQQKNSIPPNILLPTSSSYSTLNIYRRMTRIALFASSMSLGLLRAPLTLLLKEIIPAAQEGAEVNSIILGLAGTLQAIHFFLLSKVNRWHFRLLYLFSLQILNIVLFYMIGCTSNVILVGCCSVAAMIAISFVYSSHIFYTLSGGTNRAAGMATHEMILAIGISLGSFGGGVIGQWIEIHYAYILCAFVWTVILIAQSIMYLRRKQEYI